MKSRKDICVVGLGYIGLPTAVLLANSGYRVTGVDVNPKVVATINECQTHIDEPDLDTFLHAAIDSGRLRAATEPCQADIFIICVPTPLVSSEAMPKPDTSYVVRATKSLAPFIKDGDLLILESTCPVGTTEHIRDILADEGVDVDAISIAYCPERVLPGRILYELVENDRVVGGINKESTQVAVKFYSSFVTGNVLPTDSRTAEMCKLVENSFRDVNIAFANELSVLCDDYGIEVNDLIGLANRHPRVNILAPGCGVGGHCIAVDPWFIVADAPEKTNLIRTARETNDSKRDWVVRKITSFAEQFVQRESRKPIIACMGLTYKPDVADLRESPALHIVKTLWNSGHELLIVEPNIDEHAEFVLTPPQEAIDKSDIILFLVGHKDFIDLDTRDKTVMDPCNLRCSS